MNHRHFLTSVKKLNGLGTPLVDEDCTLITRYLIIISVTTPNYLIACHLFPFSCWISASCYKP